MNILYCFECNKEVNVIERIERKIYNNKGKSVEVDLELQLCKECENEISDEAHMNTQMKVIHEKLLEESV